MVEYYKKLQSFFSSVKTLKTCANEAFETVVAYEYAPRLLSLNEFDEVSEEVVFDLKRVCRLTHEYVFYLYKLYLEYRGRQPFQTINLIRQEDTSLPVFLNKNETRFYLAFRSVPVPGKNNRKDWCWIVDVAEINRILSLLEQPLIIDSEKMYLIENEAIEIKLEKSKKLQIQKAKQKVYFQIM